MTNKINSVYSYLSAENLTTEDLLWDLAVKLVSSYAFLYAHAGVGKVRKVSQLLGMAKR